MYAIFIGCLMKYEMYLSYTILIEWKKHTVFKGFKKSNYNVIIFDIMKFDQ